MLALSSSGKINSPKFATKLALFLSLGLALSLPAQGSDISVKGIVYSSNHCGNSSTLLGDFAVKYENLDVPWGVEVTVHYGFHDAYDGGSWKALGAQTLSATAPYTWEATLPSITVASKSYYAYDKIQFYFQIRKLNDNKSSYDNGGNEHNRYEADFQAGYVACSPGPLQSLPVVIK